MLFTIRIGSLSIWGSSFSTISFEANHTQKIQMIWKNQKKIKIKTQYMHYIHKNSLPDLGPLVPPLGYPIFWRAEPN